MEAPSTAYRRLSIDRLLTEDGTVGLTPSAGPGVYLLAN
jgi:hypothetical protein